ncbi:MAG: hypothetical protein Kow0068_25420 [Marinilabiliales bacterium]
MRNGKYEAAAITIDKAIIDPNLKNLPTTWFFRGKIYQELFMSDETKIYALDTAYLSLIYAIKLDPDKEYLQNIILQLKMLTANYYRLGGAYFNIKNYKEAYKMFEKALDINKTPILAVADTALIYYSGISAMKSGNTNDAKKLFKKLIFLKVVSFDFPLYLGEIYENENNIEEAVNTYKYGIDYCTENKIIYALKVIKLLLQNGETDDAEEYINIAKKIDPNNAEVYFLEAEFYNLQMLDDESIKAYIKGLQIKPEDFQANYNVGILMYNNAMIHGEAAEKYKYNSKQINLYKKELSNYNRYLINSVRFLETAYKQKPEDEILNKCLYDVYKRLNRIAQAEEIKENMKKYGINQ